MKKYLLLILLLSANLYSQKESGFQILLTHENDFLGLNNEDENYTGGFNLELVFPEWKFKQPFFKLKNSINVQKLFIGGTGYTPQDLLAVSPVIGDRPYASLVYLGLGKSSFSMDKRKSLTTNVYLGKMGSPTPGKIQSHIHENFNFVERPVPLGWHNQIGSDKNAFVLNYNVRYVSHMKSNGGNDDGRFTFLNPFWTVGIDVGNYMMNMQTGLYVDLFSFNTFPSIGNENTSIPKSGSSIGNENIFVPKLDNSNEKVNEFKKVRLNLFINPFVRYVGYNSTLQGLMFNDNSVYKIPNNEVNRMLFEFNTGINLLLYERVYLKYTFSARTREFKGGKPIHYWGGLTIGFSPKKWFMGNPTIPTE